MQHAHICRLGCVLDVGITNPIIKILRIIRVKLKPLTINKHLLTAVHIQIRTIQHLFHIQPLSLTSSILRAHLTIRYPYQFIDCVTIGTHINYNTSEINRNIFALLYYFRTCARLIKKLIQISACSCKISVILCKHSFIGYSKRNILSHANTLQWQLGSKCHAGQQGYRILMLCKQTFSRHGSICCHLKIRFYVHRLIVPACNVHIVPVIVCYRHIIFSLIYIAICCS